MHDPSASDAAPVEAPISPASMPEGVDVPEEAADAVALDQAARAALDAVTRYRAADASHRRELDASTRDAVRSFQLAAHVSPADGLYGPATRDALARALDRSPSQVPGPLAHASTRATSPRTTPSTPSTPSTPGELPRNLATALRLARWVEEARAQSSTASRILAPLADRSARLAAASRGEGEWMTVGQAGGVPDPAPVSDAQGWADEAWQHVREASRRAMAGDADGVVREANRILSTIGRAMRAATSETERATVQAVEDALTAILRPTGEAVRRATGGVGGLALLAIGGLVLWSMTGSGRR